jgi:hypothetical protein
MSKDILHAEERNPAYPVDTQGAVTCESKSVLNTMPTAPVATSIVSKHDASTWTGAAHSAKQDGRRQVGAQDQRKHPSSTSPSKSTTPGGSVRSVVGRFDDGCQPDKHERNYTASHVIALLPHAAGPDALCGIPYLSLKAPHWITRPDSNANCPQCLALLRKHR